MNRYSKVQKDRLTSFQGITGANEKIALQCLKRGDWDVQAAIDYYYTSGLSSQVTGVDQRQVDNLFKKYKDPHGDSITIDGIVQFCSDLGVDPADVAVLMIAFYMNAAAMGEFTKEEFSTGLLKLNADSLDKLRGKLPELRNELKQEDKFRDVYQWAYLFSREKGHKSVQLDVAEGMWRLLLGSVRPWPLLDEWLAFLRGHSNTKVVLRDTWVQLLDFLKSVNSDFTNFDVNGAWPVLIDEFVEHMQNKQQSAAHG